MAILGIAFGVAYQLYVKGPLKVAEGYASCSKAHSGHRIEPGGPA